MRLQEKKKKGACISLSRGEGERIRLRQRRHNQTEQQEVWVGRMGIWAPQAPFPHKAQANPDWILALTAPWSDSVEKIFCSCFILIWGLMANTHIRADLISHLPIQPKKHLCSTFTSFPTTSHIPAALQWVVNHQSFYLKFSWSKCFLLRRNCFW